MGKAGAANVARPAGKGKSVVVSGPRAAGLCTPGPLRVGLDGHLVINLGQNHAVLRDPRQARREAHAGAAVLEGIAANVCQGRVGGQVVHESLQLWLPQISLKSSVTIIVQSYIFRQPNHQKISAIPLVFKHFLSNSRDLSIYDWSSHSERYSVGSEVLPMARKASSRDVVVGFGDKVKEMRKALGLTLAELAERSDSHPTTISKIERSDRAVSLRLALVLADGLGVPLAILVPADWRERAYGARGNQPRARSGRSDGGRARPTSPAWCRADVQLAGRSCPSGTVEEVQAVRPVAGSKNPLLEPPRGSRVPAGR